MDLSRIISSLSPKVISALKQAEVQNQASALVAKKAIDSQKEAGEALINALKESALQTGKGIQLDVIV